jgi:hypothetical protein
MAYKTKYAQALEEEKKNKAILVTNTSEVALLSRKLSQFTILILILILIAILIITSSSTELKAALSKLEQQNNVNFLFIIILCISPSFFLKTRKFLESSLSSLKSENETLNMKITELAAQLETFEMFYFFSSLHVYILMDILYFFIAFLLHYVSLLICIFTKKNKLFILFLFIFNEIVYIIYFTAFLLHYFS